LRQRTTGLWVPPRTLQVYSSVARILFFNILSLCPECQFLIRLFSLYVVRKEGGVILFIRRLSNTSSSGEYTRWLWENSGCTLDIRHVTSPTCSPMTWPKWPLTDQIQRTVDCVHSCGRHSNGTGDALVLLSLRGTFWCLGVDA